MRINNEDDFIQFSNTVNGGTSYSGTTVLLDSDLDFTGNTLDSIGKTTAKCLLDVFDGQGHILSNLNVNSSLQSVGLFGHAEGFAIKNIVLDSSCSITSTHTSTSYFCMGGIVGYCHPLNGPCDIENSVNMASVSFTGTMSGSYNAFLGGIIGNLESPNYNSYIKNCLNYGTVINYGKISSYVELGGIAGMTQSSGRVVYVQNCLNYGAVTHIGTTQSLIMGGIVGNGHHRSVIENCLSVGIITSHKTGEIGSVVGRAYYNIFVNYSLWTNDAGYSKGYGVVYAGSSIKMLNSIIVEINSETLNGLTTRASNNGWNKWLLNPNNASVMFKINNNKGFSVSSQAILLPDLSVTGNSSFDGWYEDPNYSEFFQSTSVTSATTLYGLYGAVVTLRFDSNDGSVSSTTKKAVYYDTYGDLPTVEKTGYTFEGWFTEEEGGDKIEPTTKVNITESQTLYAHWTANTYTITFNTTTADGDVPQQPSQQGTYDSEYGTLPEPERTGYTFLGWFTEEDGQGEKITEDTNVAIAANHTLYAHWSINNYTLTFKGEDGSELTTINQDYDSVVEFPVPEKTGYSFDYWCTDPELTKRYDGTTMPAEDLTLYPKWAINNYTITFDFGDGVDAEEMVLDFNKEIEYPENVAREGYTFAGWDMKPETVPAQDLTIKALWIPNNYTLSFDANGGNALSEPSKEFTFDGTYDGLPEPTRTGYTFAGWFTEVEGGDEIKSEDIVKVTENTSFYAHWIINKYNFTIVFNNGNKDEVRTLDFNETIDYPKDLKKEGYTFNGWDNKPERMPANDVTVTAQWVSVGESVKPSEYVEIVFGKDFTEEEVKDILDDYTKEDFIITKFERDEKTGETRVIIKFNDSKKAEEFVENINKNGKPEHFLRGADFASGKGSFSSVLSPLSLLISMMVFIF